MQFPTQHLPIAFIKITRLAVSSPRFVSKGVRNRGPLL